MNRAFILLASLASLTTSVAAVAAKPVEARSLEPTSKWVLKYADERCTLLRQFGSGDDAVLLQIHSFGSWNAFRATLSGNGVPRSRAPRGRGSFRFPGDREDREAPLLQGTLGTGKTPAVSFDIRFAPDLAPAEKLFDNLSREERARVRAALDVPHPQFDRTVDRITVSFGRGTPVELRLGSMGAPLSSMRECVDFLYKLWRFDPAQQKSLSAVAEPLPTTVKKVKNEYPGQKALEGIGAYVPVRLLVDASGTATSCVVQFDEVDEDFKKAVCANLQGKFSPALDKSGKPVSSIVHVPVVYLVNG